MSCLDQPVRRVRIAMAQINPTVGDIEGNAARIISTMDRAAEAGAHLSVFPELALTGYPPEDLVFKTSFVQDNLAALQQIAGRSRAASLVGFIDCGSDIYNAAALVGNGALQGVYHKHFLPDYGVFDESRYFMPGTGDLVFSLGGLRCGVTICEDIWYPADPLLGLVSAGVELVINISASPYHAGKASRRERMLSVRASDYLVAVVYVNMVGGQDELVFDGGSVAFDEEGSLICRAASFMEELAVFDLDLGGLLHHRLRDSRRRKMTSFPRGEETDIVHIPVEGPATGTHAEPVVHAAPPPVEEVRQALCLGLKDYVRKNGFGDVVIGISGGIDSALVAALAAQALGPDHVRCVYMPSAFSSDLSRRGAAQMCANIGVELMEVPIDAVMEAYLEQLDPAFAGLPAGVAEENLQARIRGNILFALSNKFGWLVLTTGNKSELSVGYSTLYGDMAGGFALLKDISKTMVYSLAAHINREEEVIPAFVIDRPPSAELRAGQLDTDSLPPYDILDRIIEAYVEDELSPGEMEFADPELARRVAGMIDRSEYKRRQAPPGIKITPRAFGRDRRYPITNRYS